jgi:cardiolipin synthase (CMP-forming)
LSIIKYIPNALSISRIILSPVIVLLILYNHYKFAAFTFVFAASTDLLDGLIARSFDCTSSWGKILDPLADKILMISFFIVLAIVNKIPEWLVVIMSIRDLAIISGAIILLKHNKTPINPLLTSKLHTFMQTLLGIIAVSSFFFFNTILHAILNTMIVLVTATTVLSSVFYIIYFMELFRRKH